MEGDVHCTNSPFIGNIIGGTIRENIPSCRGVEAASLNDPAMFGLGFRA